MLIALLQVEIECIKDVELFKNMHTITLRVSNPDDIRTCVIPDYQEFVAQIDDDFVSHLKYSSISGLVYDYVIGCEDFKGEDCDARLAEIDDLTVAAVKMAYTDTYGASVTFFDDNVTYQYGYLYPAMTSTQEAAIIGTYSALALLFVLLIVVFMLIDVFKRRKTQDPSESENLVKE